MYTRKMTVNRITWTDIAVAQNALMEINPALANLTDFPVIETPEEAAAYATAQLNKELAKPEAGYEYIQEVQDVTLMRSGNIWQVTFVIAGD